MIYNNRSKKALLSAVLAILITVMSLPLTTLAVNDDFDNPDDNLVSQNEQRTDLLSETMPDAPVVSADAYILYDADSGAVLQGQNYDVQKEPASMTKVMTVLLALENLDMTEVVTITPDMATRFNQLSGDYVKLGLQEGEEITVKDLIYGAVLKSANDCSLALGMYIGGTEENFCNMMNDKATELGCLNTHFSSAFGYANPDNLTTAYDLSLILKEAVTNTSYSEISRTYSYTINATNKYSDACELTNANRFICTTEYGYEYYIGGKTGFTDTAGYTLCAAARKDGHTLIGVVFNAADPEVRYADLIHLFEYGYSNYTTLPVTEDEYSGIIDQARLQIDDLLAETNLYVSEQTVAMSAYVTTTSARAQLGSTDKIDLSSVIIDENANEQTINIPICKCYTDKNYIVGALTVQILQKNSVVEITPVKNTGLTQVRKILITFAAISGLILVLVICMLIFRRKIIRRRKNESDRKSRVL